MFAQVPQGASGPGQVVSPDTAQAQQSAHPAHAAESAISWEASEYIHHEKQAGWYVAFVLIAAAAGVGLFLLLEDFLLVALLAVMAVTVVMYARRKPQVRKYALSENGITIGDRHYSYDDFRSFSIMQEGGVLSIMLTPMRRFMPLTSIYFDPKDEERIITMLATFLPEEPKEPDFIDRFISRIRF